MVSRICMLGAWGLGILLFSGCSDGPTARTILTAGDDDAFGPTGEPNSGDTSGDGGSSGDSAPGSAEASSSDDRPEPPDHAEVCGDGVRGPTEDCDAAGESISCDPDCTFPECGDGYANASAGEPCDDGGESARCNADCTLARCGDEKVNANRGESCDDGEPTSLCDADCTWAECGDGVTNEPLGESCDDHGASASCDEDCTTAECGDLLVNVLAGESCDDGGESAACNADCTPAACGDGVVNEQAGEQCDDGLPPADGDGCSVTCTVETPTTCDGGTDPFTGDTWVVCEADENSAWISADPSGGSYHAQVICEGLGYSSVGAIGGTCGSPCSFCEAGTSCDAPGLRAFNGGGHCGSDENGPLLCTTVMWICETV